MRPSKLRKDIAALSDNVSLLNVVVGVAIVVVVLVVVLHAYFLPGYMLDVFLGSKNIIYKNPNPSERTPFLLTFDHSPSPDTGDILDVLKQYKLKAVFFVLSDQIKGNEDVMDRIVREGHTVGNHGTRDKVHALMDPKKFENDFIECDRKLRPWTRHRKGTKYFRPGFGFFHNYMFPLLEKHGYTMMLGNVYPFDSIVFSSSINAWYIQRKLNQDSIVILHDNPRTAQTLQKFLKYSNLKSS